MNTKNLSKLYLFILVFLGGVSVYLGYSLVNKSNPVEAAYTGKTDRNGNPATCRTQGTSCNSEAQFVDYNAGSVDVGQMLYCRNLRDAESDGWRYGTWEPDSIGLCYPGLCNSHSGYQSTGAGTSCGNPYECPAPSPSPTPLPTNTPPPTNTPIPQNGSISVRTSCEDGPANGRSFNLTVDVPNQHSSSSSIVIGGSRSVTGLNIPASGIQINAGGSSYPAGLWVSSNTCSNGSGGTFQNGGSCEVVFKGCGGGTVTTPPPTRTPTPTPRIPQGAARCEGLTVTNPADIKLGGTPTFQARTTGDNASPYSYTVKLENTNQVAGAYSTQSSVVTCSGNGQCNGSLGPVPGLHLLTGPSYKASVVVQSGQLDVSSCVYNFTLPTEEKKPQVQIEKKLITETRPVGSDVSFNIVVTNTGNVDIRSFNLSDLYDTRYLQFVSSTYRGNNFPPAEHTTTPDQNSRRTLRWNNLPTLTTTGADKVFTLTVNFKSVGVTTNNDPNRNCGIVNTITYNDANNQQHIDTIDQRECEDFSSNPTNVKVIVTKELVSPSNGIVNMGGDIRFKVTIKNNSDRAYDKIDFIDNFNSTYLKIKSVTVRKGDKFSIRENESVISDLQNLKDQNGNALGGLNPGDMYVLDLYFTAGSPTTTDGCDQVVSNVRDAYNQTGSGTSGKVCVKINAPLPPDTGASMLLNFFVPTMGVVGSVATRKYIKRVV